MNEKIKYVYATAGKFKFKKFFSYSGPKDNGASVIITPCQVLITPNIYNYEGHHVFTQWTMIEAIYSQSDMNTCELFELTKKAIRMDLVCEGDRKFIMIHFPNEITKEQIDLLQAFQNSYGKIVERISRKYVSRFPNNDPIVLYDNGGDSYSHSFEEALEYARKSLDKKEIDTPDENIIGQVIAPDGLTLCNYSKLKSLKFFNDEALNKGVTSADCNSFGGYIKKLLQSMRGGR